ncbi:hypothetical protein H6P81_014471 [Aristolochia fimbriata]|uniref:Glycosyl transferase family 1 domain-containing protein n=1 Tax=Aristolochia fimbriata TaxID=158543 RepID=A0AAV7EHM5_ARIFI|nr:hypothetical protein H6P81_014471 [Aristolochia fimbriata]
MGSLDFGVNVKRVPLLRSSTTRSDRHSLLRRPRSRFAWLIRLDRVSYAHCLCAISFICFVGFFFQAFLPGHNAGKSSKPRMLTGITFNDSAEVRSLEFGKVLRFEPSKLLEKFRKEAEEASLAVSRPRTRASIRKPRLAVILPDLSMDSMQLLMISVASSLLEIGYTIQVYSIENGPIHSVWKSIGVPVTILRISENPEIPVDWLSYDGVLANSLETKDVISRLSQEPFKHLPLIWTIHEKTLALRLADFASNGRIQQINNWKQAFNRATVVVFPNYNLPMMYSTFDTGNFFVIPGSTTEALDADSYSALNGGYELRVDSGYSPEDFVIAIVGCQFSYSGLWVEHALLLQALVPLLTNFSSTANLVPHLKVGIVSGNSSSVYKMALEAISLNLGFPKGSVLQLGIDEDINSFLRIADLVIYGSFLEEQSFPPILVQAMCYGKLIISPDLVMIRKYVNDRVNGLLFPKDNVEILTQVLSEVVSNDKLSALAHEIASNGKAHARNFMVSETVEGYTFLLENVLKLSSEVSSPKSVENIPLRLKEAWQWQLFEDVQDFKYVNRTHTSNNFLDKIEMLEENGTLGISSNSDEVAFSINDWEEEKAIQIANAKKRREDEELKERTDQPRGTWEEVYRSAKRADRTKGDLHERDDRELERTGQPLSIYEPYFGEGTWPFLHQSSLYRGIGLSTKGRRPGADDIDGPSRIPILNNPYYRDVLGEYGAFFAIANRIDRIHKNAWIGFQSWRASAGNGSLSKTAERALLEAIESQRHGDALYFWIRMDKDPRNPNELDFWSFCDAINAGNCRFAVSEALRRMYGIKDKKWDPLPPMPSGGGTWSVMHTWALPTRSFLEFVMFSRMFVDALDALMYDEHHHSGYCYLSLSKDPHCYSRLLELLVNVWAYHSARHMVYVNPADGTMTEQHRLKNRKGQMWVKWFSFTTLKSMDEELAEEMDADKPNRRWLWPSTGEVFWQGIYERERHQRHKQKEKRKQKSRDKMERMRKKHRQKALGKYIKPPPEETSTNSSMTVGSE